MEKYLPPVSKKCKKFFRKCDWGRTYKAIRGKTARQNKINHKIKREVFYANPI